MAILPIREFGDPVLKEKCRPIKDINDEIKKLIKNMAETMYDAPGIGLAANQLGILKQLFIVDFQDKLEVFINPCLVCVSEEVDEDEEGCLSLFDVKIPIVRPKSIEVKALDEKGKEKIVKADDLYARILLHELDHLTGNLLLDRASKIHKKEALRQLGDIILS